jgi:hypothetical protein
LMSAQGIKLPSGISLFNTEWSETGKDESEDDDDDW